jgi:hypothetical protein
MKPHILPWFRRAIAGFSPLRPGFDPTLVRVKFVVDKMGLEQVFFLLLRTSSVSIFMHTLLLLLSKGQAGEAREPSNTAKLFLK